MCSNIALHPAVAPHAASINTRVVRQDAHASALSVVHRQTEHDVKMYCQLIEVQPGLYKHDVQAEVFRGQKQSQKHSCSKTDDVNDKEERLGS